MAFKPNYNQQRAERDRNKQAKKDAKLREREEAAQKRRVEPDGSPSPDASEPAGETA
jgi:phage protein D